ncbi:MAG: hypothetical protein ACK4YQ_16785 [Phenylobacterium sp.]|uniref:hypothetical protein n=1 Tax=Phenylobacterium sp. TaxID=1871053 RepID=UPI00391DCD1C
MTEPDAPVSLAARLNRDCFCIDVDPAKVWRAVEAVSGGVVSCRELAEKRPHLFSTAPAFIARADVAAMEAVAMAVETVAASAAFQAEVLAGAPEVARVDHGPRGAFMGYDFHLTPDGPKLIEVNTNAGGAFLNALLAQAQVACCPQVAAVAPPDPLAAFEDAAWAMFDSEWRLAGRSGKPSVIAIVDEAPEAQYLYPEFLLAQAFFERRGVETIIVDPGALAIADGRLVAGGVGVDMVYNRLVDFALATAPAAALKSAYERGLVVVTPNPRNHALLADKRNLVLLSDTDRLARLGVPAETRDVLAASLLQTRALTPEAADRIWAERKRLFFKPAAGHAGKAVYRGDKLTRGAWDAMLAQGGYVAQALAEPSERRVRVEGAPQARKMDVRLYTYAGKTLLAAARLYSGQTTNFRTPGGGFAPVAVIADPGCVGAPTPPVRGGGLS